MEWDEKAREYFKRSKELLKTAIISTHFNPNLKVCVFPDASAGHWGLFVTQIPEEDLAVEFENHRHIGLYS